MERNIKYKYVKKCIKMKEGSIPSELRTHVFLHNVYGVVISK